MAERGEVRAVARMPLGSELSADVSIGALSVVVDNPVDFDEDGGSVDLNGVQYDYDTIDHDTGTFTMSTALTVAAVAGDRVNVWSGGQIAMDYVAFVSLGDGDELEVPIPYGQRDMWPEGEYDSPVLVNLSDDLETLEGVPGRTPVVDGTFLDPNTIPLNPAIQGDLDQLNADLAATNAALNSTTGIANGKTTTFVSGTAPTATAVGDLWIDTANGNIIKSWTGSAWITRQDAAIAAAQSTANTAVTSANGKSTVTYSTSSPGTAANRAGDLWFRTSGATVIEQWQGNGGTSWTSVTLTNAVIATLDAGKINTGFLSGARIDAGTIVATQIASDTITSAQIATGGITASEIAAGAVTTASMTANSIQGDRIVVNSLGADRIVANSITGDKIAANTITAAQLVIGDQANLVQDPDMDGIGTWPVSTNANFSILGIGTRPVGDANAKGLRLIAPVAYTQIAEPRFPVRAGDQFSWTYMVYRSGTTTGTGGCGALIFFYDNTGAFLNTGGSPDCISNALATGVWTTFTGTVTAPSGAVSAQVVVRATATVQGTYYYDQFVLRRMVTGTLLEPGLVLSSRIVSGGLTGARTELNTVGLQAFNSAGAETVRIEAATGNASFIGELGTAKPGSMGIFLYSNVFINYGGAGGVRTRPVMQFYTGATRDQPSIQADTLNASTLYLYSGSPTTGRETQVKLYQGGFDVGIESAVDDGLYTGAEFNLTRTNVFLATDWTFNSNQWRGKLSFDSVAAYVGYENQTLGTINGYQYVIAQNCARVLTGAAMEVRSADNTAYRGVNGAAYQNLSDARSKTNAVAVTGALDALAVLPVYDYDTPHGAAEGQATIRARGVMAQDLAPLVPHNVSEMGEDRLLGVDLYGLLATTIAAVRELNTKVEELGGTRP